MDVNWAEIVPMSSGTVRGFQSLTFMTSAFDTSHKDTLMNVESLPSLENSAMLLCIYIISRAWLD